MHLTHDLRDSKDHVLNQFNPCVVVYREPNLPYGGKESWGPMQCSYSDIIGSG